jgi:hypothetical protein
MRRAASGGVLGALFALMVAAATLCWVPSAAAQTAVATTETGAQISTSVPIEMSAGKIEPPPKVTELPACDETDRQAPALGATDNPQITNIEGGGKKYSYALPGDNGEYITVNEPPEGFEPLTATDQELQKWGFPPRPSNAAGMERWDELVGGYKEAHYHAACRQTDKAKAHSYLGEAEPSNWSGYEDVASNQRKWHGVFGRFYQPTNHGSCSTAARVASWVGLGGDPNYPGGERFFQAGTETRASGYTQGWIEWYSANHNFYYEPMTYKGGEQFVIEQGNYIRMSIYYNYELEIYYVYITNDHTGETELFEGHISRAFYDGGTAEWVDEAPGELPLLNFKEIGWYNAQTQNASNEVLPASSATYVKDEGGTKSNLTMWPGSMWSGENWTDFYYHC